MRLIPSHLRVGIIIATFLAVSITLASISPDTIIDTIGSSNAYLLMFSLGLLCGFTAFTGIPYHVILMSLAAGGLPPILLGLVTAVGVMCGDSLTYVLGKQVKDVLPLRVRASIEHLARYLTRHPRLVSPLLLLYGSLSPFSNDFIVASLSIAGYSYWRTIIPLAIGNILFNIGVAYAGVYAYTAIIMWWQ